jgi:phospholipase/carboxylesterase
MVYFALQYQGLRTRLENLLCRVYSMESMLNEHPHEHQPILSSGANLDAAQNAVIMLHGRGSSAVSILSLADELDVPDVAYLAPQAAGHSWYPYRFIEATSRNEPWLSSALRLVDRAVEQAHQVGFRYDEIVLLGFSQGACLALEYAARNARRWGGVVALSGGLIGADHEPRADQGNLLGTPVFLGCSDMDMHIPSARVHSSAEIMRALGGAVKVSLYPGMGHTINRDELGWIQDLLLQLNA